jgi:hypothetical protein
VRERGALSKADRPETDPPDCIQCPQPSGFAHSDISNSTDVANIAFVGGPILSGQFA